MGLVGLSCDMSRQGPNKKCLYMAPVLMIILLVAKGVVIGGVVPVGLPLAHLYVPG